MTLMDTGEGKFYSWKEPETFHLERSKLEYQKGILAENEDGPMRMGTKCMNTCISHQ